MTITPTKNGFTLKCDGDKCPAALQDKDKAELVWNAVTQDWKRIDSKHFCPACSVLKE